MATNRTRSRKRQILEEIARLDICLPGSLVERRTRCSTQTCRCQHNPAHRHGPYPSWIRKVGGRSITHTLSAAQAERFGPWFDNTRRLKELVAELEALSAQVVSEAEGWEDGAPVRAGAQS
ncbi:MAG: DUF6788 family protein [Mycobacterium sp.]